ncbi:MAG: energy transducer TonB [Sphingomonas sp.]
MAYADRDQSSNRIVAIVVVAVLIAALGYAFVTGLAYQYVKKVAQKMDTFDVAPPPPPPPPDVPPPPPPPEQPMTSPPVVSPPAIVPVPAPPVQIQTVTTPPPAISLTPVAAPPAPVPPPPAPPKVSQAARAKGNPGRFFGDDAYPPAARRAGAEGRVTVRLTIGTDGRVTDCSVSGSSGNSDLDNTTCRIFKSKVKYEPAKDTNGNPAVDHTTQSVTWKLVDQF